MAIPSLQGEGRGAKGTRRRAVAVVPLSSQVLWTVAVLLVVLLLVCPSAKGQIPEYQFDRLMPSLSYSSFVKATMAINLTLLQMPATYTVLVPLNSAFDKLWCFTDPLMNKTLTSAIINYHIIHYPHNYNEMLTAASLNTPWQPRTLYGNNLLKVEIRSNLMVINNVSWIVYPDLGDFPTISVHAIDNVLIPPNVMLPSNCGRHSS